MRMVLQARSLRLADDGPYLGGAIGTDGRYVALAAGAGAEVLDASNGRRRSVVGPPGCTFAAVGAGTLLWDCSGQGGSSGRTLDLRNGSTGTLPELPRDVGNDQNSSSYVGIGRQWARIGRAGYHSFVTR